MTIYGNPKLTLFSLTVALFLSLFIPTPSVELSGEWVATVYADSFIGQKHGAAWNSYQCRDFLGRPVPDRVTASLMGVAMPGAEFYCLSVVICNGSRCVTGVALDVPKEHRIRKDGRLYNHIDLMPAMAEALRVEGLQYGNLRVYVKR